MEPSLGSTWPQSGPQAASFPAPSSSSLPAWEACDSSCKLGRTGDLHTASPPTTSLKAWALIPLSPLEGPWQALPSHRFIQLPRLTNSESTLLPSSPVFTLLHLKLREDSAWTFCGDTYPTSSSRGVWVQRALPELSAPAPALLAAGRLTNAGCSWGYLSCSSQMGVSWGSPAALKDSGKKQQSLPGDAGPDRTPAGAGPATVPGPSLQVVPSARGQQPQVKPGNTTFGSSDWPPGP